MAGQRGRPKKMLLETEVKTAIASTKSMSQAAKYCGVSFTKFRIYAKMYNLWEPNVGAAGIKRPRRMGKYGLTEILMGKYPYYDRTKLRDRMIDVGMLAMECNLCGYARTFPGENKGPYALYSLDGNNRNLRRENLELRCYNCYYLTTGTVSDKHFLKSTDNGNDDLEALSHGLDIEELQREAMNELHTDD